MKSIKKCYLFLIVLLFLSVVLISCQNGLSEPSDAGGGGENKTEKTDDLDSGKNEDHRLAERQAPRHALWCLHPVYY